MSVSSPNPFLWCLSSSRNSAGVRLLSIACAVAALHAGCDELVGDDADGSSNDATTDAGQPGSDSGTTDDAGVQTDTTPGPDSGTQPDAGTDSDAAPDPDSTSDPDTGAPDSGDASPTGTRSEELQFNGRDLTGGVYAPMTSQGIKPYTSGINALSLVNRSSDPVTLLRYEIVPLGETKPEEWTVTETPIPTSGPLQLQPTELQPGEAFSFNTLYFPVQSGTREATLRVYFDGDRYNEVTLRGRARDAAFISAQLDPVWEQNWGHANTTSDLLAGAMAVDDDGNSYFTANVTNWIDGFNHDISVARMNADGTVAWARVFHEEHIQEQPDSGQNGQTGGVSRSTVMGSDGFLYVVGRRSVSPSNTVFEALILKIDPADGELVWARGFASDALGMPSSSAEAYAVDATLEDRVLVTGIMGGNNQEVMLLAVAKDDGELLWHRHAGLSEPDRGYTISVAADGAGYVGGWTAAGPAGLVMRWTGLDTDTPELEWTRLVPLPRGSLVQDISQDEDGNAYISFDIRGTDTYLQLARIDADGTAAWNAIHSQRNRGDQHTLSVIRYHEGNVYAGGRFGHEGFDYTSGDGFVLAVDAETGEYGWGSLYYTGTPAEMFVNHRVKGIEVVDGELMILQESRTGDRNLDHYWGYWYANPDQSLREPFGDGAANHSIDTPLDLVTDESTPFEVGTLSSAVMNSIEVTANRWQLVPESVTASPLRTTTGNGGHGTLVMSRVTVGSED